MLRRLLLNNPDRSIDQAPKQPASQLEDGAFEMGSSPRRRGHPCPLALLLLLLLLQLGLGLSITLAAAAADPPSPTPLPFRRPPPEQRAFRSPAVDSYLDAVYPRFKVVG